MVKVACITTVDLSLRYLLLNQLRDLRQAGYDVTGISAPGPNVPLLHAEGFHHIAVPMTRRITPLADLWALWQLVWLLRRERFTIVHTHTPKANLIGQIAAYLARVPIRVSTVHGFYFTAHTPLATRVFFQIVEAVSAVFTHATFLITQDDMNTARELHICGLSKLHLLPCGIGINLERFNRANVSAHVMQRKRLELGLPEHSPVVGFVGRLVREKGVVELFQSAVLVRARVPDVRFLMVGPVDHDKSDAVAPDTACEFVSATLSILGNKELAARLSTNGRKFISAHYTWENQSNLIHSLVT
jgi:glycosyltransferase involved in cell wall biosynthesis